MPYRAGAIIAVLLLTAGCLRQEMVAPDAVPVTGVTSVRSSFYDCTVMKLKLEKMTGQKPPQTHYFPIRLLGPGSVATTDHNLARLNIYTDNGGNIVSASCG